MSRKDPNPKFDNVMDAVLVEDEQAIPKDVSYPSFLARHLDRISQARLMGLGHNYNELIDTLESVLKPYIKYKLEHDLKKNKTDFLVKLRTVQGKDTESQIKRRMIVNVMYEQKLGLLMRVMHKPGLLGAEESVGVVDVSWQQK